MLRPLVCGLLFAMSAMTLAAQDPGGPVAALKVGELLPSPFDCFNLNGKFKGRQHCLVCEFGLRPVVLVFAREGAGAEGKAEAGDKEEKDTPLVELLRKLDDAVEKYQEEELRAGVVYLSPDARSSATGDGAAKPGEEGKVLDAAGLIEEAKNRDALHARLAPVADKLKNVVVATYPTPGPTGYGVDPKAAVTVLVYQRLRVIDSFSFAEGKLGAADVETIAQRMQKLVAPAPRKK